ncbi:MAG: hypothetical protein FWD88_06060 [Treponema sp.]|nr:hypothetical protein [Treponema sp.]
MLFAALLFLVCAVGVFPQARPWLAILPFTGGAEGIGNVSLATLERLTAYLRTYDILDDIQAFLPSMSRSMVGDVMARATCGQPCLPSPQHLEWTLGTQRPCP